jgi:glutamate-1-semialdehyde 2,1-aminomutase
MRRVAPDGPVYQAGTLSGNPLAMAAGLATLQALADGSAYAALERASAMLADGLRTAAAQAGVPLQVARVGSMLCPFFRSQPVHNYEQALACDTAGYAKFFGAMLDRGVLLPPSAFETWFLSTAHDTAAVEQTLAAAREAFAAVGRP